MNVHSPLNAYANYDKVCIFKLFHKLTAVPTYTFICYVSSYGPMAKGPGGHATNVHNIYKIKYSHICIFSFTFMLFHE